MLEKILVIAGALGLWISLGFEGMAVAVAQTTGMFYYGIAIIVCVLVLRLGLYLGER